MDISSTSSEDDLTRDKRHERRRIKSALSAKQIQEDFVKNLSDIKLETPTSATSTMPKASQKQATAPPVGTQDAATPATLQASATPAAGIMPQPVPGTSNNAPFINPYDKPPPLTLEETKARFQVAALAFTKVEHNIQNMGNLLSFWTSTLCTEMETHRQVLISSLRDVKYLAKLAREQFNFDELEVTLDTKIKDMRIIYEIIDNYLARKPVQLPFTQTQQQQSPVPSRLAPILPPKTTFQASPSPSNVSNQQFATGNTPNPNFAKKQAYQPDFTNFTSTPGPMQTGGNSVPNFQNFQSLPQQFQQYQQYPQYPKPTLNDAKQKN